jgi:hypothetical protein
MSASAAINEAMLEMHYFQGLRESLREHHQAWKVDIFKPTQRQESFVGFDQGYVVGLTRTYDQFLRDLGQEIRQKSPKEDLFYLAYFLQFKVVSTMKEPTLDKAGQPTWPPGYTTPYLRVPLYLEPSKKAPFSQHETLLRLNQMKNAQVYYACPMLFDPALLSDDPDMDTLRLVDVETAPPLWTDGESHFLMFQDEKAPPFWCSDPVQGDGPGAREFFDSDRGRLSPTELTRFLEETRLTYRRWRSTPTSRDGVSKPFVGGFPEALRIFRVSLNPDRESTSMRG